MLVCAYNAQFGTRDRGCSAHPAFPAPSIFEGGKEFCITRAKSRREIVFTCHRPPCAQLRTGAGDSDRRVGKATTSAVVQRAKAEACPPSQRWWARRLRSFAHPTNFVARGDLSAVARREMSILSRRARFVSCRPNPICDTALQAAKRRSRAGRGG